MMNSLSTSKKWKIFCLFFVFFLFLTLSYATANEKIIDQLFLDLQKSDQISTRIIERRILAFWNESGSEKVNDLHETSQLLLRRQRYDLALVYANQVIDLAPEFAEGWNTRATLYYLRKEYDLSLADIAKTLELNERHFGALNGLAIIFELKGEYVRSLKVYLELYKLTPNRFGVKEGIKRLQKAIYSQSI